MRFLSDFRPFRIVAEGFPRRHSLVGIFERHHVGQFVVAFTNISCPVTDVLDAVLFEQLHSVVGEARIYRRESTRKAFVNTKFVQQCDFLSPVGECLCLKPTDIWRDSEYEQAIRQPTTPFTEARIRPKVGFCGWCTMVIPSRAEIATFLRLNTSISDPGVGVSPRMLIRKPEKIS